MEYKVLIESSSIAFLKIMAEQNVVGQCVTCFGDIDKGIADARATDARGFR